MSLFIKNILDRFFAVFLLIVLSPLFLLVIVVMVLTSSESIFYTQIRIGKSNTRFKLFKFRTMSSNKNILEKYFDNNPIEKDLWLKKQKLNFDPRITKIGHFLREFSLDELPQIVNILRGEMSFIGPRPIIEEEISKYEEIFNLYIKVKPGLSGLWQVSGRNDVSYEKRVKLDEFYVRNNSLKLDAKIFFKTFYVVLSRKGAY